MTCQECQPLAIDLARGLPPFGVGGAVQRADVLSHIATCKRCAQWLSEQEVLSDALRAAAAADASLSAPPVVQANVMAAFRAGQVRTSRRVWPAGRVVGFAAAAIIVIAALTLASVRWLNPARGGASTPGAPVAPVAPVAGPSGGRATESAGTPVTGTNAAVIEVLPDKGSKTPKGRPAPPVAPPRGATAHAATTHAAAKRGLAAHSARPVNAARASEFSGPAFVLLPYAEPLRPTEMRHIMRVRVTRAQFAAAESQAAGMDDAAVLADVLVGEDGTARAVRIVQ